AEDGIRDFHVTGVQTCALPICRPHRPGQPAAGRAGSGVDAPAAAHAATAGATSCHSYRPRHSDLFGHRDDGEVHHHPCRLGAAHVHSGRDSAHLNLEQPSLLTLHIATVSDKHKTLVATGQNIPDVFGVLAGVERDLRIAGVDPTADPPGEPGAEIG